MRANAFDSTLIKSFPSSAVCFIESDRYNSSTICFKKLSQKGNESIIERKVFKIFKIYMLIYIVCINLTIN